MFVSYPALFYYDDTEETEAQYYIYFPDLEGGTQGVDIPDSLAMGSDYLGILLADYFENELPVPQPSLINSLSLELNEPFKYDKEFDFKYDKEKSFISMVNVDLSEYLGSNEPIKKTLTIPRWADKLGHDLHLNFSKTLTEAIMSKKMGA